MSHKWFSDIDFGLLAAKKLKAPFVPDLTNWEKNFDTEFIKEKIRESDLTSGKGKVDVTMLQKFAKEFDQLNFNKDFDF